MASEAQSTMAIDLAIDKLNSILAKIGPAQASAPTAAPTAAAGASAGQAEAQPPESQSTSDQALAAALVALFQKASLKVAKILSVEDIPNSEKLYKMQVDVGSGETRQVVAGMKLFLAKDDLLNKLVVLVLNLKPAKLAGEVSQAMMLAADTELPGGNLLVRPLIPPAGSSPGDVVVLEGAAAGGEPVKQMKSDDWKKIVEALAVRGSVPRYHGTPLVTAQGAITLVAEVPDGASIH